jgi:hypothetical protein
LFLDPISVVEARLEEDSVTVASFPTEDVVDRLSPLIPLPKSGTSRSAQGSLSEIVAEIFGDDPGKPGVAVLEATTTYGDLEVFDEHVWLFDGDGNCWTLEENDSESQEFTASPVDRRTIVDSVLDTLPA